MISAIPDLPLALGVSRVVRGVRIEHVCGDPALGTEEDFRLRQRIVGRALDALSTFVDSPTIFDTESGQPDAA